MGLQITTKREKWIRAKATNNSGKWQKLQGQKLSHIWLLLPAGDNELYSTDFFTLSPLSLTLSRSVLLLLIENINVECETMLKYESRFQSRELTR